MNKLFVLLLALALIGFVPAASIKLPVSNNMVTLNLSRSPYINVIRNAGFESNTNWVASTNGIYSIAKVQDKWQKHLGNYSGSTDTRDATTGQKQGDGSLIIGYAILTQTLSATKVSEHNFSGALNWWFYYTNGTAGGDMFFVKLFSDDGNWLKYQWGDTCPSADCCDTNDGFGGKDCILLEITPERVWTLVSRNLYSDWVYKGLPSTSKITKIELKSVSMYATTPPIKYPPFGQIVYWDDLQLLKPSIVAVKPKIKVS